MSERLESAAISVFVSWRTKYLEEIIKRKEMLASQLRAVVPESLRTWFGIVGNTLIAQLLMPARFTCEYWDDAEVGITYGYVDIDELCQSFDQLRTAWEGVVDIKIHREGEGKITVTFNHIDP